MSTEQNKVSLAKQLRSITDKVQAKKALATNKVLIKNLVKKAKAAAKLGCVGASIAVDYLDDKDEVFIKDAMTAMGFMVDFDQQDMYPTVRVVVTW